MPVITQNKRKIRMFRVIMGFILGVFFGIVIMALLVAGGEDR